MSARTSAFTPFMVPEGLGSTGAVIALEPTPKLFRLLQKSVRLNDRENICNCINIAVSSADGVATLEGSRYCGYDPLNQPVNEEAKAEFQVRTARLDNVLQTCRRVDVVKIDAGGAELAVLEGMNHVLGQAIERSCSSSNMGYRTYNA